MLAYNGSMVVRYVARITQQSSIYDIVSIFQRHGHDVTAYRGVLDTDHDKLAQLKYLCKFTAHRVLEMLCLRLCHLTAREVKHFLAAVTLHQTRVTQRAASPFHQQQQQVTKQHNVLSLCTAFCSHKFSD